MWAKWRNTMLGFFLIAVVGPLLYRIGEVRPAWHEFAIPHDTPVYIDDATKTLFHHHASEIKRGRIGRLSAYGSARLARPIPDDTGKI